MAGLIATGRTELGSPWFSCSASCPGRNEPPGRGSLMNDLEIAAFSPTSRVSTTQDSEVKMTSVKALAIIALLVGGTSLAVAQSGPATGGEPPVAGGAAGNPAVPNAPSAYGATTSKSPHKKTSKPQKKSQSKPM
jgi:hypothetical protein